jgi:5-methylcytosine-specific restriction endonuclease McrA
MRVKTSNANQRGDTRVTTAEIRAAIGDPVSCYLCGHPFDGWKDVQLEHKVPVARGGTNDVANLAWAHKVCNHVKWRLTLPEFLEVAERILRHQKTLDTNGPRA